MKLFTPDNIELLVVTSLSPDAEGLLIVGKIMGAMPMKAVLTPQEFRRAFRLLSFRTLLSIVLMLFRR